MLPAKADVRLWKYMIIIHVQIVFQRFHQLFPCKLCGMQVSDLGSFWEPIMYPHD